MAFSEAVNPRFGREELSFRTARKIFIPNPTAASDASFTLAGPDPPPAGGDGEEPFEERAAIIEFDGGIPRTWAEGLARLCTMPRPPDIPERRWQTLVAEAARFAQQWADHAAELGWTAEELFAVHQEAGTWRVGSCGLLLFLGGGARLEELHAEFASIRHRSGAVSKYFRKSFNLDLSPLRLVWEE